jgi:calcium-dependent protein kinase
MGICVCKRYCPSTKETKSTVLNSEPVLELNPLSNSTLSDKYILKKVLGQGKFGTVRKAIHKNNPDLVVAIKTIHKNQKVFDLKTLLREINILKVIDHPNIVKFYEFFEDESEIHIVMEFCSGGELFEKIAQKGRFSEEEASKYLKKMFAAVNHLHLLGICHRDLKPQNFLFEDKSEEAELKLIDFGLSNKSFSNVSGFKMTSLVGTPFYLAPEILQGKYDIKCDLWSLGVTMHFMLVGDYPFKGRTNDEVFSKISSATEANMNLLEGVSPHACDLLKKLLVKNPQFRIGASEALIHPWLKNSYKNRPASQDLEFFVKFKPIGLLRIAALSVVAKYLTVDELKVFRDLFFFLDTEYQGFLTCEGVSRALFEAKINISVKTLSKIFKSLAVIQEGKIFYSEFVAAALSLNGKVSDEMMRKTFKILDVGGNGTVTVDYLMQVQRKSGKGNFDGLGKGDPFDKMTFEDFKVLVNG